jgi:hypothetical protein
MSNLTIFMVGMFVGACGMFVTLAYIGRNR